MEYSTSLNLRWMLRIWTIITSCYLGFKKFKPSSKNNYFWESFPEEIRMSYVKWQEFFAIYIFIGFDKDNPETHGSYNSTASYLNEWLDLPVDNDSFPNSLRQRLMSIISKSCTETAIHDAFVDNKAFLHTKCIVRFGKDKLKRKRDQMEKKG